MARVAGFVLAVGLALAALSPEEQRSARIVFAEELAGGDWSDLERLARLLAGRARPWDELMAA